MKHSDPLIQAKSELAEKARAFAAAYLIRLDAEDNDLPPLSASRWCSTDRLFEELCDAAMQLAFARGYTRLG